MSANINVEKCVAYLRYARIEISDDVAAQWREQEVAERERRRAHNREMKKSCGHFATQGVTT